MDTLEASLLAILFQLVGRKSSLSPPPSYRIGVREVVLSL